MSLDLVYFRGSWWLDTQHAAAMLNVSPDSLKRHHSTVFAHIDFLVWHRVLLFSLDDVSRVSAERLAKIACRIS